MLDVSVSLCGFYASENSFAGWARTTGALHELREISHDQGVHERERCDGRGARFWNVRRMILWDKMNGQAFRIFNESGERIAGLHGYQEVLNEARKNSMHFPDVPPWGDTLGADSSKGGWRACWSGKRLEGSDAKGIGLRGCWIEKGINWIAEIFNDGCSLWLLDGFRLSCLNIWARHLSWWSNCTPPP